MVEQAPSREERRAERKLKGRFAPRLGWGGRFGGRVPVEDAGTVYTGPTSQAGSHLPVPAGLGPAAARRAGRAGRAHRASWCASTPAAGPASLTTNPGMWVMSQPGAGKSALVKRVCLVYSAYGHMVCVPGDVKGEYIHPDPRARRVRGPDR